MDDSTSTDAAVPYISDEQIQSMFAAMEQTGYCCVPNFINTKRLTRMQEFVSSAVEKSGNKYISFVGSEPVAGSGLDQLASSSEFKSIFSRLYTAAVGSAAPPVDFYQLLRCLTGKGMEEHSFIFHYDSYLITALIPVVIPTKGRPGDLYVIPNTRKIRKTYLANLIDKIFLDNRWSLARLRKRAQDQPASFTRIKMIPGNLYFFWGYRSIHANEPCDPGSVRATALYHYLDPHAGSFLKSLMRR